MRHEPESTRVRVGGTVVTRSKSPDEKFVALKRIVDERQYAKIDGVTVDGVTANMLVNVCNALNPANRNAFLSLSISKMVSVGWELVKEK